MLQIMRRGAQSWVAKGLFIILLVSFAVWGIGPIFQGGRVQTAATAGNVKISSAEADQAFMQQVRQFERQYGMTLNSEMIAQLGFKRQIIQQLVMQALYDQEASKLGLRLSNELIQQTIASQPPFRNVQGQFDPNLFRQLLSNIGMSESQYVAAIKGDVTRLMLMGSIQGSANTSDILARTVFAWQNEKRIAESLEVKASDMRNIPSPTEEDLNKYLSEHSDRFMAPEYRAITYITIDLAKISAALPLEADEIRQAYEAAPADYGVPEKRNILQVTLQDETVAKTIAAEAATKPLAEVAKAHDLSARAGENLTRGGILKELADVVFTLEPNKASQAVQSPMGWHVIEVTKVTPAVVRSFDEVKTEIEVGLRMQKGQEQVYELTRKLQDNLASGATMEETAKELGLQVTRIPAVTHDGYRPDGTKIEGDPNLAAVLKTAFAAQQGEAGQVQEVASGAYAVTVDSITPAQAKALADVKGEVTTAWTAAKRLELANAKANELANSLRNGETLRGLARSEPLARDGSNIGKLPQTALSHIFASKEGDVLTAGTDESVWVIRVSAITPAVVEGADLSATRTALHEQMGNDLLEQFATDLRGNYGVELNDAWLKQSTTEAQN